MKYSIQFSPAAERELRKLSPKLGKRDKRRIAQCIEGLAKNPFPEGARKLAGSRDIYRIRIGDYRIAYIARARKLIVLILKVGNRKEFYERIRGLEKRKWQR